MWSNICEYGEDLKLTKRMGVNESDKCITWHDGLQARVALGRVLVAVAVGAHQQVILGGEGPVHQRPAALDAQEAVAVPVALLVRQILQERESEG